MDIFLSKYRLMIMAVVLFWLKTCYVMYAHFNISLDNKAQEWILIISPLSSALLFFGMVLLVSEKYRSYAFVGVSALLSIILYGNVVFYRFFSDYVTVPLLFQTDNMGALGSSVTTLMYFSDILIFIDVIILVIAVFVLKYRVVGVTNRERSIVYVAAVAVFLFNLGMAEIQRPQLLTRAFDREMLIKNIGIYNYHMYDVMLQTKTSAKRALATGDDFVKVKEVVDESPVMESLDMFGVAEGKNVIVLSLESLQSFVMYNEVDGNVITPFLNELAENSYYFPNFYHQTAQGKTSDSEFLLNNSLYGLPRGSAFFTHSNNKYDGLPSILEDKGYSTSVQHANNSSFWNRDVMYKSLGYGKFYDINSFDVNENNSVGWGLKDKDFFLQSIDHLKEQDAGDRPYYTKYITLTNHFPFELGEEDMLMPEWDSNSRTLNRYFPTVRYMDESVKVFFDALKNEGLYKDTVFVIYGDHYGISENHNKAMGTYLETEIDGFETVQLQRVPLLIHVPGHKGKVIETVGGQIDLKPTILNMLGIGVSEHLMLGNDLFAEDREAFVVLRDGSVVTDEVLYKNGVCYRKVDKVILTDGECDTAVSLGESELALSDKIIYGDLLRFLEDVEVDSDSSEGAFESEKQAELDASKKVLNTEDVENK